ncbi:hypothetical protein AGMMS49942_23320 [Spirochaetia bacterium]|nr:hypothetical protein AGMMS49942_23320 [Spirochaetia bacterium]
MKFYSLDSALGEAIEQNDKPVRVQISLDWSGNGHVETVLEKDIIEASFTGLKEVAGGTTARGEVLLDNTYGAYACGTLGSGREVRISFSVGDGLPYFERFVLYVDDKGFQDVRGPGRMRRVRLTLRDRSAVLRKTDESRDWTKPSVFTYSVVCDKTQSEKSLVHLIAQRAGLGVNDIDCATIPVSLPYVRITKNVWAELSELATAYRCHLECPVEKPLVFAHSPYQSETFDVDEASYTFKGSDIFYLRFTECVEQYRNAVRLKINIPVSLEKQEIWRYCDPPVVYNEFLTPRYPFRFPAIREIEKSGYEARYTVKDGGQERAVIYADSIDTQEETEMRLGYDGGAFRYSVYDVTSHRDRAGITLHRDGDGDLYGAAIYGRPIVLDLNRSCFLTDTAAVGLRGTAALNVTGSYFSEDAIDGRPQYEDWARRELAERLRDRREITVKTHRGMFHARVGAVVMVHTAEETVRGTVNALSLRYKRGAAFVAAFRITEVTV